MQHKAAIKKATATKKKVKASYQVFGYKYRGPPPLFATHLPQHRFRQFFRGQVSFLHLEEKEKKRKKKERKRKRRKKKKKKKKEKRRRKGLEATNKEKRKRNARNKHFFWISSISFPRRTALSAILAYFSVDTRFISSKSLKSSDEAVQIHFLNKEGV